MELFGIAPIPFGSVPVFDDGDTLMSYAGEVDADTASATDVALWDDADPILACSAGVLIAARASPRAA